MRFLPDGLPDPRPRLRGVVHAWAVGVTAFGGVVLVALAPAARARLAALVYAVCVGGMFLVSAVYHRHWWRTARARMWMRRLDHSTIFLCIAGTYTPFALLVLEGWLAPLVLGLVWGGTAIGIGLNVVWARAPRALSAIVYLSLGWVGLITLPQMFSNAGVVPSTLVIAGGLAYTVGAIVYALRRPDPVPHVFGYHEVFHALVALAALTQYVAVAHVVVTQ
jgi:hemolysin III